MPERSIKDINDEIMKDPSMQALNNDDPTEFESSVHKIYHAHGYDTEGKALPLAQQLFGKASRKTGIPEASIQSAAATILPTVGAIAGASIAPIAPMAGASFGGYAGAKGNELLGITDLMSTDDSSLAVLSPIIGPLGSKASQLGAKSARYSPGAQTGLNEMAGETMKKSFDMARVTKQQVDAANAQLLAVPSLKIKTTRLRALFDEEMKTSFKEAQGLDQPELHSYAERVMWARNALSDTSTKSFKDLMTIESGLLKMKAEGSSEVWTKASGELIGDLEDMVANPKITDVTRRKAKFALDSFRNVIQTTKKYHANEALDGVMNKVFQPVAGNTDLMAFNKKEFLKELKTNKTLTGAYDRADLDNMIDAVESLGYLGNMSKMSSAQGAVDFVGRSGPLAALGYAAGGQTGAMIGFGGAALVSTALSSDMGRKIIKWLAKQGRGKINAIELRDTMGKLIAGTSTAVNASLRAPSEGAVNAFENQE